MIRDADGSVVMYTINATTGALTSTGAINGNCPGLCLPSSVVVDPSGKFAYVANGGGGSDQRLDVHHQRHDRGLNVHRDDRRRRLSRSRWPWIHLASSLMWRIRRLELARVDVHDQRHDRGLSVHRNDCCRNRPCLRGRGSIRQVRLCDEFQLERRLDVHHQRHTGALTSIGTIAAGTDSCLRGRGSIRQVRLCDEFRLERRLDVHHQRHHRGLDVHRNDSCRDESPTSIAVHPSGKFAYVTNSGSNDVSMYSIDAATGALTLIGTIGT